MRVARPPTILAVNHRADTDRRRSLPDTWAVWPTTEPAGATYHRIAAAAVEEAWDQATIVVQDDVRWTSPPRIHEAAEIVVYGAWAPQRGHACPRAFAASSEGWRLLAAAWADEPDRLCDGFRAAISETTVTVLDQIEHTEPAGSRPWPRRRAA